MGKRNTAIKVVPQESEQTHLQKGLDYHDRGNLEVSTYFFKLSTEAQESPISWYLLGVSLRHGWGCVSNQKGAILCFKKSILESLQNLSSFQSLFPSSYIAKLYDKIPEIQLTITPFEMNHLGKDIKVSQSQQQASSKKQKSKVQPINLTNISGNIMNKKILPIHSFRRPSSVQLFQQTSSSEKINLKYDIEMAKSLLSLPLYELANCYLYGWGVEKSIDTCEKLLSMGARLGDLECQLSLTHLYSHYRLHFSKSKRKVAYWLRQAESNGWSTFNESWVWKPKYDPLPEENLDNIMQGNLETDTTILVNVVEKLIDLFSSNRTDPSDRGMSNCVRGCFKFKIKQR